MQIFFTDYFEVKPDTLEKYGAFNISLINDLPLFIDPFLLFTSKKQKYRTLHDDIIKYLRFLRDESIKGRINSGLLSAWYMFPEVKQLWLGYSLRGNNGSGLGKKFATALNLNLNAIFSDFGNESLTQGSHLEKVCLIDSGVGKDNVSDFTANLIKEYLCEYTQKFAKEHIDSQFCKKIKVSKVKFDYQVKYWKPAEYILPYYNDDYVLLTPRDILSKDDNWINRPDLIHEVERLVTSMPDTQLRGQLNDYLGRALKEDTTKKEERKIFSDLIRKYPAIIEHYIKWKENNGDKAIRNSKLKVSESEAFYIKQVTEFAEQLAKETEFYKKGIDTYKETYDRVQFLKSEIEDNGGYRIFYNNGKPIQRESDLQILFRLTWYATPSDFNSEVNNGRGPVDFKISRGNKDKTLVEFKLAKNSKLAQNLKNQMPIYQKANRTKKTIVVIFYFSDLEYIKVKKLLKENKLENKDSIILVDAQMDNKPSASVAK